MASLSRLRREWGRKLIEVKRTVIKTVYDAANTVWHPVQCNFGHFSWYLLKDWFPERWYPMAVVPVSWDWSEAAVGGWLEAAGERRLTAESDISHGPTVLSDFLDLDYIAQPEKIQCGEVLGLEAGRLLKGELESKSAVFWCHTVMCNLRFPTLKDTHCTLTLVAFELWDFSPLHFT